MSADFDTSIGGYASEAKQAENYFWGHQLSTIINGLLNGGLYVTYFKEYDRCVSEWQEAQLMQMDWLTIRN